MNRSSLQHQLLLPWPAQSCPYGALSLLLLKMILALLLVLLAVSAAGAQTNTVQERLENAAALIRDNRIVEAEQQLKTVLKVAPNEAAALNLLGTLRAQQGKLNEAEVLLTRATKIDPDFVAAHMNLAFLYVLKNCARENHLRIEKRDQARTR